MTSVALAASVARAGDVKVTLKGTKLTLKGDGQDATLTLSSAPATPTEPATAFVEGQSGTTVNGTAGALGFPGVTDLNLQFSGAAVNSVGANGLQISGALHYKGGAGNDSLMLLSSEIAGNVLMSTSHGGLGFTCLNGHIGGKLTVKSGPADDGVMQSCAVDGAVSVSTGEGTSLIEVAGSDGDVLDLGPVTIKTGSGGDLVTVAFSHVHGDLKVDAGSGDNEVHVNSAVIDRTLGVKTKTGSDTVSGDTLSVADKASFDLGNGSNEVDLKNADFFSDLSFSGGSGDDVVELFSTVSVAGKTKYKLGGGTNTTETGL